MYLCLIIKLLYAYQSHYIIIYKKFKFLREVNVVKSKYGQTEQLKTYEILKFQSK